MKFIQICALIVLLSSLLQADSMKDSMLVGAAGGLMCKVYAEEIGADVKAFSDMNAQLLQVADKLGYLNNLQSYLSEVDKLKHILKNQLLQKHNSNLNIYNNWCIPFYNGMQKGLAEAY